MLLTWSKLISYIKKADLGYCHWKGVMCLEAWGDAFPSSQAEDKESEDPCPTILRLLLGLW